MKTQSIIKYFIAIIFLTVFYISGASAQELQGFSGHWVRNDSASNFGNRKPQIEPAVIDITVKVLMKENGNSSQTKKQIKIVRNYAGDQGKYDGYTEDLDLDGSPITISSDPDTKKTTHIVLDTIPDTFTEIADYVSTDNDKTQQWNGKLVWSLSQDNQVLTVTSTFDINGKTSGSTIVYKKR